MRGLDPVSLSNLDSKVVVAMSGGVDSSAAALILRNQGLPVVGISMQVWDYRRSGGSKTRATCCAPDDFTDARRVAASIGVPYYVFDFEATFRSEVIDKFVRSYQNGLTPNPCIDCNNKVKFRELRNRALSFGFGEIATGHYARIEKRGQKYHLLRGVDMEKDQSYFLYGLSGVELATTRFPVGHLTKPEVRELARSAGLVTAEKPESQDICFVSGSVSDFLVKVGGRGKSGSIVRRDGRIIGQHQGTQNFTVGQRRGLNVGGNAEPLYVLEIDPANNLVIVGEQAELKQESFIVEEVNWINPGTEIPAQVIAQLRHRHRGVLVNLRQLESGEVEARFENEWSTASPGQAAVFYDLKNEEVLGGGTIQGHGPLDPDSVPRSG